MLHEAAVVGESVPSTAVHREQRVTAQKFSLMRNEKQLLPETSTGRNFTREVPEDWLEVAAGLALEYSPELDFHPQVRYHMVG